MSGVMIPVIVVLRINFCRMGEEEGEAGAFTVIEHCPHPQRGEQMHHLPRTVYTLWSLGPWLNHPSVPGFYSTLR